MEGQGEGCGGFLVAGGKVKAPSLVVPEELNHLIGEGEGLAQPRRIKGGLIELDESPGEEGVVVDMGGKLRFAAAPAMKKGAVAFFHVGENEGGAFQSGTRQFLIVENGRIANIYRYGFLPAG